jgi:hypothetical protein
MVFFGYLAVFLALANIDFSNVTYLQLDIYFTFFL